MRHSELMLLAHLSDADSLDTLAREGFLSVEVQDIIRTDFVRHVTAWALDRFYADGRMVAPSREAILSTWGETFEQFEVPLPDPEVEIDSIGWVIDELRANHARITAEKLITDFAAAMGQAEPPERVDVFVEYADRFYSAAQSLISHRHESDGYDGVRDALMRLADIRENGLVDRGMHLGIDMIDAHMHGIHPGEICAVASESGVGKSFLAVRACITEWRRGRKAVLVTLENDVEMTYDRFCCMACGIDYESFQLGRVEDAQLEALLALMDEMEKSEHRPLIVQIDPSQRTVAGIVRKAQLEGADSLIIDQLSFMKPNKGTKATQRNFQVVEIMQTLKEMVNEHVLKIPVLLLVQINREGAKAARKEGRYRKDHMQDSAMVEQTVDHLWAIFMSDDMEIENIVQFQCLKARRFVKKHFEIFWRITIGLVYGMNDVDLGRQERAA